jgi:predicted ATPase
LIALKGARQLEVEHLYQEALEIADRLGDSKRRFQALWNLWFVKFTRGDYAPAIKEAEALLQMAERVGDEDQLLEAHHSIWPTLVAMGRQRAAGPHLQQGLALYSRERHAGLAYVYAGHDPGACCRWHLAMNRWLLGFPEQAVGYVEEALHFAAELKHPQTTGLAMMYASWLRHQRGETELAVRTDDQLIALAEMHGFQPYLSYARVMRQIHAPEVDSVALRDLCNREFAGLILSQWRRAFCICALAERCASAGHTDEAREAMAWLTVSERTAVYAAEVLRVEGEVALRSSAPDFVLAEERFRRAMDLARSNEEKSLELRAATSLARLWAGQNRRSEAHGLLSTIYDWFTEGFETADLRAAKSLLDDLG